MSRGAPIRRTRPSHPPLVLARLLLVLMPFLAAFTACFGLFYLWGAVLGARQGNVPYAALSAVMGIAGLALAATLWRTWRRVRAVAKEPPMGAPTDRR
jgi:hypothetical protein